MKNSSLAEYISSAPKKVIEKPRDIVEVEKPSLCGDSFTEITSALNELLSKVSDIGVMERPDNTELLDIYSEIIENLNTYHLTVIEEMAKIDVNPVVDMSKLDVINDRLLNIIQTLAMRKPKEWDFEIERDMMGEMTNVKAKEVTH